MFSLSQRVQYISNQAVTYGSIGIIFIIVTFLIQLMHSNVFNLDFSVSNVKPYSSMRTSRFFGSVNGKPKENIKLSFDLDVDLSPLFNWNTKQVFVYLTGEYQGFLKKDVKSEVTFWDSIITSKDKSNLSLSNIKSKYSVWDIEDKFEGKEMMLKLHWNIQPWVGPLIYGETSGEYSIMIPQQKKSKQGINKKKN